MLVYNGSRNRVPHQGSTASFRLITSIVMIVQHLLGSCLLRFQCIRKGLPQLCRLKPPPLGMKVIKIRIDTAADKFQLRHLPGSQAIRISIT